MKILVIDDETYIRNLISYNLSIDGHDVVSAPNGKAGLQLLKKEKPDLILLDVMMPGMYGLEVLSEIKRNPQTRSIPVFMLTAKGQFRDIERAFSLGADNYITKPFDVSQLNEMITHKLSNLKSPSRI